MAVIRLDIDTNRDGQIDPSEDGRWDWAWGPGRPGAVAAVDCDVDARDPSDWAEIRLIADGLAGDAEVALSLDAASAGSVTLWAGNEPVVGLIEGDVVELAGLSAANRTLHLQVHAFPDASWDGLIELIVGLVEGTVVRPADRVVLRVSPWVMPSTLQPPEQVYVIDTGDNEQFLTGLQSACDEINVPLTRIERVEARGDRWIQDEIEIGYSQQPTGPAPVILDGARDNGLHGIARARLAGNGVGVYELHAHLNTQSSLDSFGNLEVSPPVIVGGTDYGLGRIILGTKKAPGEPGEKASLALRRFLHGQRVQAPLEIHSDWLYVGHVDEVVSFVPSDGVRGWKVLLASPNRVREILTKVADDGDGDAVCFEGKHRRDGSPASRTVAELLDGHIDWVFNDKCTTHIARVKEQLKAGLALGDDDFAEIPVAFNDHEGTGYALAYFPDMVNHLILGPISVVPDPYGPIIGGTDPFKDAFLSSAGSRGPGVRFIDDWTSYHEMMGEVHCGTNVRRTPNVETPWWALNLPGLWDASVRSRV